MSVSISVQGLGLGGDLLLAAGERALAVAQEVGGVALAIDARDEKAAGWYERFGALPLLDDRLKLLLPRKRPAAPSVAKGEGAARPRVPAATPRLYRMDS